MYTNPPPEVDALKTMLVASSTWSTLAGSAASTSIHYPSLAAGPSASPDPAPSLLIDPNLDENKLTAPSVALPYGMLTVQLRMKEVDASAIEKTARAIAAEIAVMPTGLPIVDVRVGMSSGPDAASRAAQAGADAQSLSLVIATRTIAIIVIYALG